MQRLINRYLIIRNDKQVILLTCEISDRCSDQTWYQVVLLNTSDDETERSVFGLQDVSKCDELTNLNVLINCRCCAVLKEFYATSQRLLIPNTMNPFQNIGSTLFAEYNRRIIHGKINSFKTVCVLIRLYTWKTAKTHFVSMTLLASSLWYKVYLICILVTPIQSMLTFDRSSTSFN